MTEARDTLFGDTPATQTDRLRTQLAAVALLVARTDRDAAQEDILLATIFEVLRTAQLSANQIKMRVEEAWPRLSLTDMQFRAALQMAESLDLIRPVVVAPNLTQYELLSLGRHSLDESLQQASDNIDRFRDQIADEMRERRAFRDSADANDVASTVIECLRMVIADALRTDAGGEIASRNGALHLVGSSPEVLDRFVEDRIPDAERADLIKALTNIALDHSRGFGNELVHRLVVGHVLYLFMGRPDRLRAAAQAGSLAGETIVLDTPILVALLAAPEEAAPVRDIIAMARQLNMRVVMYERTVTELRSVLDNVGTHEAAQLEVQLRDGADARIIAGLQRHKRVLHGWLHWCSKRDSGFAWDVWRNSADGDAAMLNTLRAIGVELLSDDVTAGDFELSARCAAFAEELRSRVESHGSRARTAEVIRHDALNLTVVYRARRDRTGNGDAAWPGAFLLTTDGQVNETYDSVAGKGPFPAAITISQLAELLAACATPRQSEELAFKVAGEVAQEILLARSLAIPVEVAGEIARALRAEPVSEADVEQLALDISRAMADGRGRLEPGSPDNAEWVGRATRRFRERKEQRAEEERTANADAQRRHELAEVRNAAALESARNEAQNWRSDAESAKQELDRRDEEDRVRRREQTAERVLGVAALVSIVLVVAGHHVGGWVGLAACVLGWLERPRWAAGKAGPAELGLAMVYAVFTVWPLIDLVT